MTLDTQILEVIQQLGGIFLTKNVPAVPIDLDFLEERVAHGMESLVVTELILYLDELFDEYKQTNKRDHRLLRYSSHFRTLLDDNSDNGNLVGRSKKRSA